MTPALMCSAALLSLLPLALGQRPPADALLPDALQPLQFLVGSCWSGKFKNGATDTHCFEPVFGHFIRDRHEVVGDKDAYRGETLYRWDAKERVIRFTYWNSSGGVSEGTARSVDGDLVFPETHRDASGQLQEYRNVWRRTSENAYVALTERRIPAGWTESFRIEYRRTGPASSR